jgi:hypothetical protein
MNIAKPSPMRRDMVSRADIGSQGLFLQFSVADHFFTERFVRIVRIFIAHRAVDEHHGFVVVEARTASG